MTTPLPPVDEVVRAAYRYTFGDNVDVENILYFHYSNGGVPLAGADCATLANDLMSVQHDLAGFQSTEIALESVTVTDLTIPMGAEAVSTAAAVPGTVGSPAEAAGTCVCVTQLTTVRGRSFRGRIYFPGIPQTERAAPQSWNAAYIAAMSAGFITWSGAVESATGHFALTGGVVSFYSGKEDNPNPLSNRRFIPTRRETPIFTPTSAFQARVKIASQRRRNN